MRAWVLWVVICLFTVSAFAAGPIEIKKASAGLVAISACPGNRVVLGGACRNKKWIKENLADAELLGFGNCTGDSAAVCAMWYSELVSATSHSFQSTAHFLTNTTCLESVSNCSSGFEESAQVKFSYEVSENGNAAGSTAIYGWARTLKSISGPRLHLLASYKWTETASGYSYEVSNSAGEQVAEETVNVVPSTMPFNWWASFCNNAIEQVVPVVGAGGGAVVGGVAMGAATSVAMAVSTRMGGLKSTMLIFVGGAAATPFAATLGGLLGYAGGETVVEWAQKKQLCEWLFPDDPPEGDPGPGPGNLPPIGPIDPPEIIDLSECDPRQHLAVCTHCRPAEDDGETFVDDTGAVYYIVAEEECYEYWCCVP